MTDCRHEKSEIRYLVNASEQRMYRLQCLDCGEVYGKWLPKPRGGDFNPIDNEAAKNRQHNQYENQLKQRKIKQRQRHHDYEEYILSNPQWQTIRKRVLKRCGYICESCLIEQATQVHHLAYDTFFDECAWHLKPVCRNCHQKIHGREFSWIKNAF